MSRIYHNEVSQVRVPATDEVYDWLRNNCSNRYYLAIFHHISNSATFAFYISEDALAFRLKFGVYE